MRERNKMRRYSNTATLAMLMVMIFLVNRGFSGNISDWFMRQLLILPGIIIGLSLHEFAHAAAANALGDITPKLQGRLTVNPLAHIDIFGFVTIFIAGFGWGRAVEINPYNFKNRRRDELIVSVAGVSMNLLIAIIFSILYRVLLSTIGMEMGYVRGYFILMTMVYYIVYINIVLMIFNLLPIPPLDGFSIATEVFDLRRQPWYWNVYNNGFLILMVLVMTGTTSRVMSPIIQIFMKMLGGIGGF